MSLKNEERKREIYEYINLYIKNNGASPSTAEICRALCLSKATVSKYVNRLQDEKLLDRVGRYGLISRGAHRPKTRMPIIGVVACGKPILAEEDVMGYISVDEDILDGSRDYFALIAEGDSMIEADIKSGDIVYIEKSDTAEDGVIVAAMITDEETAEPKATLKRFFKDTKNHRYILHPENKHYPDIIEHKIGTLHIQSEMLESMNAPLFQEL